MTEAPKKIWTNIGKNGCRWADVTVSKQSEEETLYIRADLVDELVEALNAIIARWDTPLWKDAEPTSVCIGKGRAALKALEEE